jgi:hypothetical protein
MGTALILIFGVLLPVATLGIELMTGMCASSLFDPMPTLAHAALVACVPLASLLGLLGSHLGWNQWRRSLLFANGVALGIAAVYSLAFVPIMPIAVIAVAFMGLGMLPLSPLCSLLATIGLRVRLVRTLVPEPRVGAPGAAALPPSPVGSLLGGAALGVGLLLILEARDIVTVAAVDMAASDLPASPSSPAWEPEYRSFPLPSRSGSAARAARGLSILRHFGSRDEMLRLCYQDGDSRGILSPIRGGFLTAYLPFAVSRADAQKVFFRVMGEPYNAFPPPRRLARIGRGAWDEFDFDPDVGGQAVAGRRRGLSLDSSRMDVQVHPAVAHVEWTMVFRNEAMAQCEARAQIALPPGGVVSRATLWVNGEPQEAAFGAAGQVRAAYQEVAVVQRRDPLLVTWAANGRVLLQCFPVPSHGEMKVRLGISAPLIPTSDEAAALRLPCFAERNFNVTAADIHALWVKSDQPLQKAPDELTDDRAAAGPHVRHGALSDTALCSASATLLVTGAQEAAEQWTPDPKDPKAHVVEKTVTRQMPVTRELVLVVDGSAGMRAHVAGVAAAVAGVSPAVRLRVLLAGDTVEDLSAGESAAGVADLAARLDGVRPSGGCDNVPALLAGMKEAAQGEHVVVWIHAPQPVALREPTPLVQWLQEDPRMTLYDVAVAEGPNYVLAALGPAGNLQTVARLGSLDDDLGRLLAQLTGRAKQRRLEWTHVEAESPATPQGSSHLARLWAADRVLALVGDGKPGDRDEAVKLATTYQIVTPVSGAVVLESKEQYERHKLQQANPESVANTPEPATWALLLAALPGFGWLAWRRRRRQPGQ